MSTLRLPSISPEEYIKIDSRTNERHEYHNGQMFAMSGGSMIHSQLKVNLVVAVQSRLKNSPCRTFDGDLRLLIETSGTMTYPDLSIFCGPPIPAKKLKHTFLNPTVLIEVLSPSTERYDRGKKFAQYRTISSLKEYILAAQDEYAIDHFRRTASDQWALTSIRGKDATLTIASASVSIPLSEIYDRVSSEELAQNGLTSAN